MLYTNSESHKIATCFYKNKRAMQNVKKQTNTKPAGENMSYSLLLVGSRQRKQKEQFNEL